MSELTLRDALVASLPPVSYDPGAPQILREAGLAAAALADAEQFVGSIFIEQDPAKADVTLGDWERVLGLPDCCSPASQTVQERVAAVVERWTLKGGLSLTYFVELAARMGVTITIDELGNYTWRMNGPLLDLEVFRAGAARAGDRLRTWGSGELECRMDRLKPAHTRAVFGYSSDLAPSSPLHAPIAAGPVAMLPIC
ncbi:MAG: DUF2313 domain-containing protein [Ramlibacter sp.]|nr:DUF2313 domain-containing protein [Ramlibacter sp.]